MVSKLAKTSVVTRLFVLLSLGVVLSATVLVTPLLFETAWYWLKRPNVLVDGDMPGDAITEAFPYEFIERQDQLKLNSLRASARELDLNLAVVFVYFEDSRDRLPIRSDLDDATILSGQAAHDWIEGYIYACLFSESFSLRIAGTTVSVRFEEFESDVVYIDTFGLGAHLIFLGKGQGLL